MMKLKHIVDNEQLVNELIKEWLGTEEFRLSDNFRISSNSIYMFNHIDKDYVIRFAPLEEKELNQIKAEVEFVNYLRDNYLEVPKFISSVNGKQVESIQTEFGEYYVTVYEKIKGISSEDVLVDEKKVRDIGRKLAMLHGLSSKYIPTIRRKSVEEVLNWLITELGIYENQEEVIEEALSIKELFGLLKKNQNNYGLIHFDFELDNLLYDKDEDRISIIDFDDSMYNFYGTDIVQTIDNIKEETDVDFDVREELLTGYRSLREYNEDSEELLRRFGRLLKYVRVKRSISNVPKIIPEWMEHLIMRLTDFLNEYKQNIK